MICLLRLEALGFWFGNHKGLGGFLDSDLLAFEKVFRPGDPDPSRVIRRFKSLLVLNAWQVQLDQSPGNYGICADEYGRLESLHTIHTNAPQPLGRPLRWGLRSFEQGDIDRPFVRIGIDIDICVLIGIIVWCVLVYVIGVIVVIPSYQILGIALGKFIFHRFRRRCSSDF